ncbi:MAG TPA: hypothetical protein VF107_13785 [Burkholderiaceae bacterium]
MEQRLERWRISACAVRLRQSPIRRTTRLGPVLTGDVRRFYDAALAIGPLGRAGWQAIGTELIRQLGVR